MHRDVTEIEKASELESQNKVISMLNSTLNHEMLAPLRCMIRISTNMLGRVPFELRKQLKVLLNTATFLLSHV